MYNEIGPPSNPSRKEHIPYNPLRIVELSGETDKKKRVSILLVGVNHIGWPPSEYEKAYNEIDKWNREYPNGKLVIEGIVLEERPKEDDLGEIYDGIYDMIFYTKLVSEINGQHAHLNDRLEKLYDEDRIVRVDMKASEMARYYKRKGMNGDIPQEVTELEKRRKNESFPLTDIEYNFYSVLVDSRNSRVFHTVFKEVQQHPDETHSYVILYGLGHIDDFVRGFTAAGFTHVNES